MSRIGKLSISIPEGVTVTQQGSSISVKGPNGQLQQQISSDIECTIDNDRLQLHTRSESKEAKSAHGLYRMLIANMVTGVSRGFQKELLIQGVGYRAEKQENSVILSLGYSTQIEYRIPEGIEITIDKRNTIGIRGIDKQLVGQVAADIRSLRPPEPYKGKGIRYANEHIRLKVGKAGVK